MYRIIEAALTSILFSAPGFAQSACEALSAKTGSRSRVQRKLHL
jgi:hypothetical protein